MHLFGRCLNHDDSSPTLEPIMIVWTLYAMNELKPKSLWLNSTWNGSPICFLNESKPNTWARRTCIHIINIKGQKLTRCMPSKCMVKPFQANTNWSYGSSLPSAIPSHFIIIKVQAHQASSILNRPRRSKWPNFTSLHIWFVTS